MNFSNHVRSFLFLSKCESEIKHCPENQPVLGFDFHTAVINFMFNVRCYRSFAAGPSTTFFIFFYSDIRREWSQ